MYRESLIIVSLRTECLIVVSLNTECLLWCPWTRIVSYYCVPGKDFIL